MPLAELAAAFKHLDRRQRAGIAQAVEVAR